MLYCCSVSQQRAGAVAAELMRLFPVLHNCPTTGLFSLQQGAAASLLLASHSHLLSPSPIAQSGAITQRSFPRTRVIPRPLAGGAMAVRDTTIGMATMTSDFSTSPISSTPAENLGRYATPLCGEWSVGAPAAALKSLVPDLSGDHHKGQVKLHMIRCDGVVAGGSAIDASVSVAAIEHGSHPLRVLANELWCILPCLIATTRCDDTVYCGMPSALKHWSRL